MMLALSKLLERTLAVTVRDDTEAMAQTSQDLKTSGRVSDQLFPPGGGLAIPLHSKSTSRASSPYSRDEISLMWLN